MDRDEDIQRFQISPDSPNGDIIVKNQNQKRFRRPFKESCVLYACFIAFFGVITVLAFAITLLVYSIQETPQLVIAAQGFEYLIFNLQSHPILELTTASPANLCPAPTETINFGRWTGTVQGCLSRDGTLTDVACPSGNRAGGASVGAIPSVNLFKWEDSVICAKRARLGTDYVKAMTCPSGFQSCSPGICLLNSLSCPITSVTFGAGSDPNYKIGSTSKYIISSSVVGDSPLIHLSISLNSIPCFHSREIPAGNGDYVLLSDRVRGCTSFGPDSAFSNELDRMSQEKVFQLNGVSNKVYDLPGYTSVFQGTSAVLSARKRITMGNNDQCLGLDTSILSEARDSSSNLINYFKGTSIATIAVFGILLLGTLISLLVTNQGCKQSWREVILDRDDTGYRKPLQTFYILLWLAEAVIVAVMGVLAVSTISKIRSAQTYIKGLVEIGCFLSGAPLKVVIAYDDVANQVTSSYLGLYGALVGVMIIAFIPLFYARICINRKL